MKIVIPGGTGQVGALLARALRADGHEVVLIGRDARRGHRTVVWDGRTLGPWARELDGADVVINLAGRSVNCRYTAANLGEMMGSRVDSTRAVGLAIAQAAQPAARLAADEHRDDLRAPLRRAQRRGDRAHRRRRARRACRTGASASTSRRRGSGRQAEAATPATRKVALRAAMVMSPDRGGIFDVLLGLTRRGLGGTIAGGRQFMSWIHERDFVRAVELLLERDDLSGPVNLAAPTPLPQREFMAALRAAWGTRVGLPATRWMAEIGAFFLRTDTELTFKSRRVVPGRLRDAGFTFEFPEWPAAAADLVARWRAPLIYPTRPHISSRSSGPIGEIVP